MILQVFIILLCCYHQAFSLANPGILVQIPTSYNPPILSIPFPQSISSMLIQNLELTNIKLRSLEYDWKLEN